MAGYYEPGSLYGDRSRQSQEQAQREPHLLSLKVLRASRPTFSQSKDIFRDETSTEDTASTSGFTLTPLLALPTTFGNINLGETFQGLIVAANDSPQEIYDASLRIEVQTANSRTTLWESPPPDKTNPKVLTPGDTLEAPLLSYEIKEPGLHALSCSVSYWAQARNLSFVPQPGAGERYMRNFRKLYKFQASNPLAVKTKIHTSKNAAAQLDEEMGRTVFLEVQIQNTSPEPLFLEQLQLNPSEYQQVEDLTSLPQDQLQPGDLLQCLYIVKAEADHQQELLEKAKLAGGSLPLGKLDIRWRNRMGDSGHLATSQLIRRLPPHVLPPAPSPRGSVLDIRTSLNPQETPNKWTSATTPDHSPMQIPRIAPTASFSPAVSPRLRQMEPPTQQIMSKDLTCSLLVLPSDSRSVAVGQPFAVNFRLSITSLMRESSGRTRMGVTRTLKVAVQHVKHTNATVMSTPAVPAKARVSIESQAPTDTTPLQSARASIDTDRPLPSIVLPHEHFDSSQGHTVSLPPPKPLLPEHPFYYPAVNGPWITAKPDPECQFYGNALIYLEDIEFFHSEQGHGPRSTKTAQEDLPAEPDTRDSLESTSTTDEVPLQEVMRERSARRTIVTSKDFSLKYVASAAGIYKLGGVRVLLLEDSWHEAGHQAETMTVDGLPPCTLLEHVVVAEVKVDS